MQIIDIIPEINLITVSTGKSKEEIKKENNNSIKEIVIDGMMNVKPNVTYLYGESVITTNNMNFWDYQWDMQKSIGTGRKFSHKSTGKLLLV